MKSIVHIITGLGDGGAEAVLFRLCTADTGHRHLVISLGDLGKYGPLLQERDISVTAMRMPRGRVTLSGLWLMWRKLRKLRPDAIQTWMYHANLLGGIVARLAGYPNVIWGIHHTTLDPRHHPRVTIMVAQLCARLSRLVPRHIICCAEQSRTIHARLGYDSSRMRVVPNGYDLTIFRPDPTARAALRAELDLDPAAPVIGFVARFDPQKDHGNLLAALSLLKRRGLYPTCLLIGSGMTEGNGVLTDLIDRLGIKNQVRFLGRRSDIPAVMNALDLHVMSSLGEAFPNVLAQAMACGTPCVSTDVGDAASIIGDTGWIVPAQDAVSLAEAITKALSEIGGPSWQARRVTAYQRVESLFSIERMAEGYHTIWFSAPTVADTWDTPRQE
jgi:glycosyltransferase involved in cell wall biosynthesis